MRKILSGFLATSMIVAVASSVAFASSASVEMTFALAAGAKISAPAGSPTANPPAGGACTVANEWDATIDFESVTFTLPNAEGTGNPVSFTVPVGVSKTYTQTTAGAAQTGAPTSGGGVATYHDITIPASSAISDIVGGLNGQEFDVMINNYRYSGKIERVGNNGVKLVFRDNTAVNVTGASATLNRRLAGYNMATFTDGTVTVKDTVAGTEPALTYAFSSSLVNINGGSGTPVTDIETSGTFNTANCTVADVIYTDGNGDPLVLTEKKTAVDEDQNTEGGVQSGKTLYFLIRDDDNAPIDRLEDDTYWKMKITKGDNGKYIKAVSDVTKIFSKGLYPLGEGTVLSETVGKRHRYIKVEMNEIFTDDEYKMTLDMRLSAKSKAVDAGLATDDSEFKVKDFYFYMKNLVKAADNDWKVGVEGLMLNPIENDWNDVTWYDEDGDLAHLKFFADSNVDKFYSKLSTKWEHADYASYFNDQDAFIFNFTGSPKLSSTSRADLEIYNPFLDEDGNETIDPSTAVIYQVIDGDLYDVTDSWKYEEGDNGDMAFTTRTRFLGTYIICEKPVEEAVSDDETVPDELIPDTTPEAPEDTTPDNNGGGKAPANTGKYL